MKGNQLRFATTLRYDSLYARRNIHEGNQGRAKSGAWARAWACLLKHEPH
jgi:hypothetical protein